MNSEYLELCVNRDIEKERKELPSVIYLIPESDSDNGNYWVWCDEPAPSDSHIPEEAVRYIREDK